MPKLQFGTFGYGGTTSNTSENENLITKFAISPSPITGTGTYNCFRVGKGALLYNAMYIANRAQSPTA
jgi:hypothetical protein